MDLKIFKDKTNSEVMDYLGAKIRGERKKRGLSQKEFASKAGVPLRTYKRFEQDCNGTFENFVKVLRALDKVNFFQTIFVSEIQKPRLTLAEKIEGARKISSV